MGTELVSITRKSTQKSLVKSLKYTSDDRTEISHKHTLKCPSGTDHLPRPNRYCESPQSKGESQSIFVDYMVSRFSALIRPICEKHRHTKTGKKHTPVHFSGGHLSVLRVSNRNAVVYGTQTNKKKIHRKNTDVDDATEERAL